MASFKVPRRDLDAAAFFEQFARESVESGAALGWTPEEIAQLSAAAEDFHAANVALAEARAAAVAATTDKNEARAAVDALVRRFAQRAQASPAATALILSNLGLNVVVQAAGPVAIPANLTAEAHSTGIATLQWKTNGNKYGTVYIIETREFAESEFKLMAVSTRRRFVDRNAPPGVPKSYRVRAQRAGVLSGASFATEIYGASAEYARPAA